MESYSLFQVNEYIKRVIALNFREPLWIEAEIMQIKESRGSYYLELIEKEEDGVNVIAQAQAAIWYRGFSFIKKKLGDLVYDLLKDGTQVRVKCQIDFHERYGMKLIIEDIDPNYTFGKLELKRQEIINRLEAEGLMEINKGLELPDVVQRIAVISSATAAGYQDFYNQLKNNPYGFTYKVDLYNSAVQGSNVEHETLLAIESIINSAVPYHAVAIMRGGGSKLDLSGYDNYEIAKAIAISDIPFIIGIGHDIDSTVTDLVACLSLKTPTAVADFLIEHSAQYESHCVDICRMIGRQAVQYINQQQLTIQYKGQQLNQAANNVISHQDNRLVQMTSSLTQYTQQSIRQASHQLEMIEVKLAARDPRDILAQGYAYVKRGQEVVGDGRALEIDDEVTITFRDGERLTKVIK